jgi:hypothetical protein
MIGEPRIKVRAMPNIDPNLQKEAVKEALKEWLDDQFHESCASFGKWAIKSILAAAFCGLVYLALIGFGWHK